MISEIVNMFAGSVNDLFAAEGYRVSAEGYRLKAKGSLLERENYLAAAGFSDMNALFTSASTGIKTAQAEREMTKSIGRARSAVATSGLKQSGSALDILADSARQGSLTKSVLATTGAITELGYKEQGRSYRAMADSAQVAADAANVAAEGAETAAIGAEITSAIRGGLVMPLIGRVAFNRR